MIPELFPRNKNIAGKRVQSRHSRRTSGEFRERRLCGRAPLLRGADAHMFSNDPITLPLTYLTEIGSLGAHTILYTTADSVVLTPNVGTVLENTVGGAMMSSSGMSMGTNLRHRCVARFGHRSSRVTHDQRSRAHGGGISNAAKSQEGDEQHQQIAKRRRVSFHRSRVVSRVILSKITTAATLADVAGWSMIAFQAAFYERVFSLTPQEYDPLLAFVIPIAGVTGGLGGGWICDKLQSTARTRRDGSSLPRHS